jgi:hypothetical protein
MSGTNRARPVTGGTPLAEGAAPAGCKFKLTDPDGNATTVQTQALASWKDGSARWLLVDFLAQPPQGKQAEYTLTWGDDGDASTTPGAGVSLAAVEGGLLEIADRLDVALEMTDAEGVRYTAQVEETEIETSGPVRATLALRGQMRSDGGGRAISFRLRASTWAGTSLVKLEPLIIADPEEGILYNLRELRLTLMPTDGLTRARLGGETPVATPDGQAARLLQVDDENYRLEGMDGVGGKARGWLEIEDDRGAVALALREFWQQWPKSLEVDNGHVALGLFPRFTEGDFDHMQPWYKYLYLFEGDHYRLRTGQARRWEIWLDLAGDGEALARDANAPLVPAADPAQAIATGVWDEISPAGVAEMTVYDAWAERLFDAYCKSIVGQRDYGVMNWGDWFGERKVNWGNHEYDTTNQLLIQFARTGDPRYLYVADAAAHHSSEVDTIHFVNDDLVEYFEENFGHANYPSRAGMVHEHAVGHVGCFYPIETVRELYVANGIGGGNPKPYLCLDPYNLGHIFTQGMARHYFLTGDPFIRETVEMIGGNLAQLVEDRQFKFMGSTHCGRVTGWTMLALAGAYEIAWDERYLRAMKTLAEDAMADQDPVCGGWLIHPMAPDHCTCKTARHTGMAGFITAILINGLSRYYQLSGDERLPDCIDRAVTFLDNDTWREEHLAWRYTSCPASPIGGQPGVTMMAHVNGARFGSSPNHLRILGVAWEAKFGGLLESPSGQGFGKSYTATMYGCAQTVGMLARRSEG